MEIENSKIIKNFRYISTLEIVFFTWLTCGLYGYYLLYKWIEVLNAVDEDSQICNPFIAVFISFFTCGLAFILFDFIIPDRAAYYTRKTKGSSNKRRDNLTPPIKDLPMIILMFNLFFVVFSSCIFLLSFSIVGLILWPPYFAIYFVFCIWANISMQRSIEYLLCIDRAYHV